MQKDALQEIDASLRSRRELDVEALLLGQRDDKLPVVKMLEKYRLAQEFKLKSKELLAACLAQSATGLQEVLAAGGTSSVVELTEAKFEWLLRLQAAKPQKSQLLDLLKWVN